MGRSAPLKKQNEERDGGATGTETVERKRYECEFDQYR